MEEINPFEETKNVPTGKKMSEISDNISLDKWWEIWYQKQLTLIKTMYVFTYIYLYVLMQQNNILISTSQLMLCWEDAVSCPSLMYNVAVAPAHQDTAS